MLETELAQSPDVTTVVLLGLGLLVLFVGMAWSSSDDPRSRFFSRVDRPSGRFGLGKKLGNQIRR